MLEGKIAIVTGAGKGIGRAIALQLAQYGAKVVLNYRSSISQMEELMQEIHKLGGETIGVQADVSKEEDVKRLLKETLDTFGRVDILVNNAGITKDNLLMKMTEEDFNLVTDINMKGTFLCMKHISNQMIRQRSGKIINISSIVGITGNIGQTNYAASKAGVIAMTKSVAKELASRGITVNAVAPGFIQTEMTEVIPEKWKEQWQAAIPLKRFGSAKEVAEVVSFLASEAASYITGQVIQVDGGMVM